MTEKKKQIENLLDEYRELLKKFEKWISLQTHLPQNNEPLVLLRYLCVCDYDLEKAKELLEINVKFRTKNSYVFTDRDMNSPELQKVINTVQVCPLPKLTKEHFHITVFRLINTNSTNFNVNETIKWIFMVLDTLHMKPVKINGDICIFDAKDFSLWHFFKLASNVSTVRIFMRYVQEAIALRIVQNHFVNCSPVLTKIIALIRPLMSKELSETMHFHTTGFESMHEFIPKELLPTEYNGTVGELNELYKQSVSEMQDLRDYINNDDNFICE
ncbi:hypothetical protein PVAND_009977 [Polypedilum vanderplanki]|uniref:CRAL-TRIO domain-containing protein n=1 Tax=Polypedilum vanderplanki TaxID=319348 RepID=A0A9J6CEV5_POLVA|nr:hypothetical protein PVAND_009977 [Polypedilum vanderplanki]